MTFTFLSFMRKRITPLVIMSLLSGCGALVTAPVTAPPTGPGPVTCTLGAHGYDIQVQITNSVPCGQEEAALATDGLTWAPVPALASPGSAGTADGETMGLVCQLVKGDSTITVMDAGGQSYGTQVCSSDEQGGWTAQQP